MRVLVTGSGGNIGRPMVQTLREVGHEIRTFDRSARHPDDAREHVPGDVRDIMAVRRAVEGMDAVMHLGAIPNDRRGMAEDVLDVNVRGTWHVLLACAEAGVGRVVYMSSVNSLGNFNGHRPALYLPIDDPYPRHPMSPYQLSKHLAEEACRAFTDMHDMVTLCLRPVYVAQPDHYDRWREWSQHPRRAEWGKGDYWAYVDIRDVCDAALRALTVDGVRNGAFLITADDTTNDTPTADLVARHYADTPWPTISRADWLSENPHRTLLDCSGAKRVLGWQPRHSWRDHAGSD